MPNLVTPDGVGLFFRRWGKGEPVVFLHGWASNSEIWQPEMLELSGQGLSCIAYDRRGHGRSDDPGQGYDFDTLAADLHAVLEHLDLRGVTLVGHSMGNGEITRYLTRYGASRIARTVMIAPALPYLLRCGENPDGVSEKQQLEDWRRIWKTHYVEWLGAAVRSAYGEDASPDRVQWTIRMMSGCTTQAAILTNIASAETDFREELPSLGVPTLILHGDHDQSCPIEKTGRRAAALIPGASLKVYEGAGHTMIGTHAAQISADILTFLNRAGSTVMAR
jgi:non-heme chloroperoxidase